MVWESSRLKGTKGCDSAECSRTNGGANINILFRMIARTKDLEGDIAECGVYLGQSAVAMALYLRQQRIEKRIYGFDSFEGFDPESVRRDLQLGGAYNDERHEHGFIETSEETVLTKVNRFRLTNIELIPGYFSQSLGKFSRPTSPIPAISTL
jgi:hypothetical protein